MIDIGSKRITFGKYKGKQFKDLPEDYLKWMVKNLRDSDLSDYAALAEAWLNDEERIAQVNQFKVEDDLDKRADEFLRRHGYNPNKL